MLAGRGGRIIRVTSLAAEGPGSLREALTAKGARIVVFEVGGVIDLQMKSITIAEPFLTVAGQTAPAPGVTLIRGGVAIRTHDVLMRHMRFRPGDAGQKKGSGWEPDVSLWGPEAFGIVLDHCSFSWGVAGNLTIAGPISDSELRMARNITISDSIIAEGLQDSTGKSAHSLGASVMEGSTNVAFIGNLFAHNEQGNPWFHANTTGIVVNNLIYNPGHDAIQLDWRPSDWTGKTPARNPRVSVAGNVMFYGADTNDGLALIARKGDAFLADNLAYDQSGTPAAITTGLIETLTDRAVWPRGMPAVPAAKVFEIVLRHAGARPKDRDEIDRRILADVRDRKGRIINSQEEVGGYPKHAPTRRRLIIPTDDIDDWLAKMSMEVE